MPPVRLQKYLAACGVASRRTSEKLILDGRVTVNGHTATLGQSVDPDTDAVLLDNKPLHEDRKIYLVLNKPAGAVTTASDTHGRPTVLDSVKDLPARVFPVGRLDMDVEGVLLLTNDGELGNRLIHPRYHVDKVYQAWVQGHINQTAIDKLERGVLLEDGMTAPARCEIISASPDRSHIRLTIHEGRKREVKRMCAAVGHPVRHLCRVAFGTIRATGLRPGEWRYLNEAEIKTLQKLTGLAN